MNGPIVPDDLMTNESGRLLAPDVAPGPDLRALRDEYVDAEAQYTAGDCPWSSVVNAASALVAALDAEAER